MKRRHFTRYIQVGWVLVLILLLVGIFAVPGTPADASQSVVRSRKDAVGLNAKVYLTQATLRPLFQDRINQQVPGAVNAAINSIIGNLPGANQIWAGQMAQSLLQPSASLTQLTPQQDGLHAVIRLSLYPNDPKPTDVHMLVKFSVLDASTVQISGQPIDGSPTLVNGPLATIKVPIGQLNSINTTPNCGDANLMIGLQVPVDLSQTASTQNNQSSTQTNAPTLPLSYIQNSTQTIPSSSIKSSMLDTIDNSAASKSSMLSSMVDLKQNAMQDGATNSYIEIPADSLATLGNNIGNIQISKSLSAQNIQLSVQDSEIVATSDIMGSFLGAPVKLATATTTIQPAAQDGNLVLNVQQTKITVAIVTFSQNSYNQQIEQLLNNKLSSALAGKFNVTSASLGNNTPVSCAASDSLMLTGTATLQ